MVLSPVRAAACSWSAALLGRSDRRFEVAFAILFILASSSRLRAFAAPHDWDLDVRRATVFRVDSIVWGYLLYLALEKRPLLALKTPAGWASVRGARACIRSRRRRSNSGLDARASKAARRSAGVSLFVRPLRRGCGRLLSRGGRPVRRAAVARAVGFWLGRISYSAYLFHIVIVMALKPMIAGWPLPAQLALYVALICAFSTVFWRGFERPILAARPDYAAQRRVRRFAPPSPQAEKGIAPAPACARGLGCGERPGSFAARPRIDRRGGARPRRLHGERPSVFYPALVAAAVLAIALAERAGRFAARLRRRRAHARSCSRSPCPSPTRSTAPRPACRSSARWPRRPIPIAPRARIRRPSPCGGSTISTNGSATTASAARSRSPTRRKSCPSSWFRGAAAACSTRRSRSTPPASAGRRSPRRKGDRSGSSRSANRRPSGRRCATARSRGRNCCRACSTARRVRPADRGHQRRNGGLYARGQSRALRRDVLPLKPDLIVSTHGMNGLLALGLRQQAEPNEPGVRPRASALIGRAVLTIERAVHDLARPRNAPRSGRAAAAHRRRAAEEPLRRGLPQADRARRGERRPCRACDVEPGGRTQTRRAT